MKLITIEPFDGHGPNEKIEVPDAQARKLIDKGLAKAAPAPSNKMALEGENKADPSEAAGKATTSSASRAAPRSARKTATPSADGAPKKSPGRPRKSRAAG
jgi:hypothetical protein